jgi:predicted DNA-binding transcriptional regulator YafY
VVDGVLTISFTDTAWLARIIAGAGASAVVLEPPDLVEAVLDRLRAVAGEGS